MHPVGNTNSAARNIGRKERLPVQLVSSTIFEKLLGARVLAYGTHLSSLQPMFKQIPARGFPYKLPNKNRQYDPRA